MNDGIHPNHFIVYSLWHYPTKTYFSDAIDRLLNHLQRLIREAIDGILLSIISNGIKRFWSRDIGFRREMILLVLTINSFNFTLNHEWMYDEQGCDQILYGTFQQVKLVKTRRESGIDVTFLPELWGHGKSQIITSFTKLVIADFWFLKKKNRLQKSKKQKSEIYFYA